MGKRDLTDEIVEAWRAELPSAAGLPLELSKRVARLGALFGEATEPILADHNVTKAEHGVLAMLRAAGPPYRLRPGELSGSLIITTGGISNVLQRLVTQELVSREPDPKDGRSSWVRLTPKGADLAGIIAVEVAESQAAMLAPLPEETGRALADLLREVLLALDGPRRRPRRG